MKIKKEYTYTNNRQIWRLLLTETNKLIIEERNTEKKEVFFNCLEINTGRKIFNNFQLEEKFWVGIESVSDDIIFFHKYQKPDMPGHKGIIALDINLQNILWQTDEMNFLFLHNRDLYAYKEGFENRTFYKLEYKTGAITAELGNDVIQINQLREKIIRGNINEGYYFPEPFEPDLADDFDANKILKEFKTKNVVTGKVEFIKFEDMLLFNSYMVQKNNSLRNIFRAVEILSEKIIFEEVLNAKTNAFVPDTFFIKDRLLFLLKEKTKVLVCSI